MRIPLSLAPLVALPACAAPASDPHALDARASELARRFVIVDGHVDVPYRLHDQPAASRDDVGAATAGGNFDRPRALAGGLDAPFFSIFTPAEDEERGTSKRTADELIDICESV